MGRTPFSYDRLSYEMFDAAAATNRPTLRTFARDLNPVVDLRQMISDYESEAVSILGTVLSALRARWP